jgi:serine/threonine protein kinase/tetratricopeptide (TPR) repeat protein
MHPDPQRIDSIFLEAAEKATDEERAAYLDVACAGDPQLRERVERLLAARPKVGGFLEAPAPALVGTVEEPPAAERPGTLVGPYKLLEQIGEGGMGTVWMAEQSEPIHRRVAVKVVKEGMDSRQVLARFEAERQALALMDHPNIAKVLDAGKAPSGRPYFVMELVKGRPITGYCDDRRLGVRERLALFGDVCRAVQHAHQKGVIHRDLKPSNVLVAPYDGKPVVKVIDFGVAKATGQRLTDKTLFTGFGALVGTPEYMSPEQAEVNNQDIDTRSDIYALGVLLYELLTGSTPLTRQRVKEAALLEVLRLIREEEPPRPSTRLSESREALPSISAQRQTEPAKLTRLVRGELDWIVMKALEKDRNRRYETANGFAMDVQRYLADEPVHAGRPSPGYRLRKFVGRNRGRVAASVALSLSLLAGLTAVLVVQARADRDRAARGAWTDGSVTAAAREARERADEAWVLKDHPDRMRRATEAALAALRRADDYVAGGPASEGALTELADARRVVDDLARHARLISAEAANLQKDAEEIGAQMRRDTRFRDMCNRIHTALREFGLDPIEGPADEVARVVAGSRIRDTLLGMLLRWQYHAFMQSQLRRYLKRSDLPADAPAIRDRLGRVVRTARQLCGGAYARWQDLLDRNDIPGLVAFSASPDARSFQAPMVKALGQDLVQVEEFATSRAYLRAGVERYPDDAWLHIDLATACVMMKPSAYTEALRHHSAALALRPGSAQFHLMVAMDYDQLGSYEQAVAAYRKSISTSPFFAGTANRMMGVALMKMRDWDGAITALREASRLLPQMGLEVQLPRAHANLYVALQGAGRLAEAAAALQEATRLHSDDPRWPNELSMALAHAGRPAEGLQVTLAALRNSAWAEDPRNFLRYEAACVAMHCADGKGADPTPVAERPALRKQALDLMTADLAAIRKFAATDRAFAHEALDHRLVDEDFASVRDPKAIGQLPPTEREAWSKLWAEVRELRDRPAPPPGK